VGSGEISGRHKPTHQSENSLITSGNPKRTRGTVTGDRKPCRARSVVEFQERCQPVPIWPPTGTPNVCGPLVGLPGWVTRTSLARCRLPAFPG
jgi:hypothetical protein